VRSPCHGPAGGSRFCTSRLYHIALLDHASPPHVGASVPREIKALRRKLRQHGIPARGRACIERDDEKGLHCHVFVLLGATAAQCAIINAKRHGVHALQHASIWLSRKLA
jgi:hypothetical protein